MKNSSTVNDLNNITKNKQINQQTLIYHNGVIIVTKKKQKQNQIPDFVFCAWYHQSILIVTEQKTL